MSALAPGFLVAAPPLGDPHFDRSVVLLAAHNEQGAFGWVINGAKVMTMEQLIGQAELQADSGQAESAISGDVLAGGPVGRGQVWLIYPSGWSDEAQEGQFEVGADIIASSSRRILQRVAAGESPPSLVAVAGYAGWGPGQLENEISQGAWLPTEVDASLLFDSPPAGVWLGAFERAGTSALAFTTRVVGLA